jgi:hypothetical protein
MLRSMFVVLTAAALGVGARAHEHRSANAATTEEEQTSARASLCGVWEGSPGRRTANSTHEVRMTAALDHTKTADYSMFIRPGRERYSECLLISNPL